MLQSIFIAQLSECQRKNQEDAKEALIMNALHWQATTQLISLYSEASY